MDDRMGDRINEGRSSGLITFLFTDIEGSTRRWVEHGDRMARAVARHDEIVTSVVAGAGGHVFATGGDGFAVAFDEPSTAVDAALAIQRRLAGESFADVAGIAVRMGLHTGPAEIRNGDYFGPEVARAARIGAAGHGGQVLLSEATVALVGHPTVDLGAHVLRDFPEPQSIHQLAVADVAGDFAPLRSLEGRRTTLPSPRSAFFGRTAEIDRLRRLLHEHRLVTLTGVGGTGKTRLAIEVAWEELPGRPGGAFFADLTSATDADDVVAAVITGTVERSDGTNPRAELRTALARLDAVLVVDNCEHLLDESAELVEDLLDACPDLRIVVTSREPLDIEGEQVLRVSSLASDDRIAGAPGAAVRLFADRARGADPDLDLAGQEPVIADICERLDGIPLAIELAAARTRVLTPAEILDRLDDRFSLLTGSRRRRGHQRQKTLEATVAWSYELLDDHEQAAFRSLAVLERGFDLAAATAVIDVDDTAALDVMDSLVAKSLVGHDPETGRFTLLETLRQYAEERLVEAGEADAARHRHLAHYRQLVHRPQTVIVDQDKMIEVVDRVDRERPNIVAALEWAEEIGDDESLIDVVLGTGTELAYGHPALVRWLDEAIERAEALRIDPVDHAALLLDRTFLAVVALDAITWSRCAKRARELLTDDHPVLVGVLSMHGFLRVADAPEITVERCQQALDMAERLGVTERWRSMVESHLAGGLVGLRRYEEAAALVDGASRYDNLLGDGVRSSQRAPVLHLAGRSAEAIELFESDALRTSMWRPSIAGVEAVVLTSVGRRGDAVAVLLEAASQPHSEGVGLGTDNLLLGFATLRADQGEPDRARELADVCAGYRTPGSLALLVELVARLDHWPDDEFHDRRRAFVAERFTPDWVARSEARHAQLLAEEVAAFEDLHHRQSASADQAETENR